MLLENMFELLNEAEKDDDQINKIDISGEW